MSILTVILVIVVVGVLLWALNSFVPMDSKVRSILNIVVVILLILWLLQAFGLIDTLRGVRVGVNDPAGQVSSGLLQLG
jgi:hypothetical protein